MDEELVEREQRPVRIQTLYGSVEGYLHVSSMLRTLDDLNLFSHEFLTVDRPVVSRSDWSFEDGPIGINAGTILFVNELSGGRPKGDRRVEASRFTRAAVRMRVGEFDIQGFLHVPGRGGPMRRLNRERHPFIGLTSVSVFGADSEFAAPFLAVNRMHILAVQEIPEGEPILVTEESTVEA